MAGRSARLFDPVGELLDQLAARRRADRWLVCWPHTDGWVVHTRDRRPRDELYVQISGLRPPAHERLDTDELGDAGLRLSAAGVSHVAVAVLGEPERPVYAFLENPDPAGADTSLGALVRQPGWATLPMLEAGRWLAELSALQGWLPALEDVATGRSPAARALAALGDLVDADDIAVLWRVRGVAWLSLATRSGAVWEEHESASSTPWETVIADPRSALLAAAEAAGRTSPAAWVSETAAGGEVVIGVRAHPVPVSPESIRLFGGLLNHARGRWEAVNEARHNVLHEERARIASIIHEGIAQVLTNVVLQLEVLDQVLDDRERARAMLQASRVAVVEALESLRGAIFELTPPNPEWTDLATGLDRFVTDFGRQWGIVVDYRVLGDRRAVDPDVLGLVFATVQEGLTNVRKHSGVAEATVTLNLDDDHVAVTIADDGCGFEPAELGDGRLWRHQGLSLTASRSHVLGAHFQVDAEPGGGTRLRLRVRG